MWRELIIINGTNSSNLIWTLFFSYKKSVSTIITFNSLLDGDPI